MARKPQAFGEPPQKPTGKALPQGGRTRKYRPPENRGSAASRGYDSRWRRYRLAFLASNPLCVHCRVSGRVEPGVHVDHKIPSVPGEPGWWDPENHQALCHACHARKTIRYDGGLGNEKRSGTS